MPLRTSARIDEAQIDEMDLTISFTLTVEQWRKLMRQQGHIWPASDLGSHIASVLGHVTNASKADFRP